MTGSTPLLRLKNAVSATKKRLAYLESLAEMFEDPTMVEFVIGLLDVYPRRAVVVGRGRTTVLARIRHWFHTTGNVPAAFREVAVGIGITSERVRQVVRQKHPDKFVVVFAKHPGGRLLFSLAETVKGINHSATADSVAAK